MDTADALAADPYPDDTVTVDGRTFEIPHTPELCVVDELCRARGVGGRMVGPYDPSYRRPLDTLDDRL